MALRAEPFTVAVPDRVLDDLRQRLAHTRWPLDLGNDDWAYGTNATYLRSLCDYWRDGFDWRSQERAINELPHYRVEIDGVPVHYIHVHGRGPDPLPLVLSHGWPWTFWDFRKVIGPLADPASNGGDAADAFDVVVPSLPGYVFSTPVRNTGGNFVTTADLWVTLMQEVLGYERFGAHGSDWGAAVTAQLGHKYADRVVGIHLTHAAVLDVWAGDRPWDLFGPVGEGVDAATRAEVIAWQASVASHVAVHILDPQTLAYGLHDSPAGLCAWLLERRRAYSDCGGDVERRFSRDELLTLMTLYWVTECFVSSIRYYRDAVRFPWRPSHDRMPVVEAPTGYTHFVRDVPRMLGAGDWLPRYFNLVFHRERERGGHYAAAEEPEAIVEDLRETFRGLRAQ